MSTTTEKIEFALNQLRAKSKNDNEYAESILEFFGLGQEHRFSIFAYVFKSLNLPGYIEEHIDNAQPPDPEPLDCWVTGYREEKDSRLLLGGAYHSKKEAEYALQSDEDYKIRKTYRMRQVTPQMLRDEKDAARFRRLTKMAGVAWQPGNTESVPGNLLREEIDKVMEDE